MARLCTRFMKKRTLLRLKRQGRMSVATGASPLFRDFKTYPTTFGREGSVETRIFRIGFSNKRAYLRLCLSKMKMAAKDVPTHQGKSQMQDIRRCRANRRCKAFKGQRRTGSEKGDDLTNRTEGVSNLTAGWRSRRSRRYEASRRSRPRAASLSPAGLRR